MKRKLILFTLSYAALTACLVILVKNPIFFSQIERQPAAENSSPELLRQHVAKLTSLQPHRSFPETEPLDQAARYISETLRSYGLAPRDQEFQVEGKTYRNVIARLGPAAGELLVIGAHYDVAGQQPGADDNASGVAGLLELARILAARQAELKRPIELVAYTLEEPPNFSDATMGSYIHAYALKADKVKVKLMISLEMIGYFSDAPNSQSFPVNAMKLIYPSVGNFIAIIGRTSEWSITRELKKVFVRATALPVETLNAPAALVPPITFSDHSNYWDAGYSAVMVTDTAFMRNPHYHQVTDTIEALDFKRMAEVVNGVARIAREL